MAIKIIDAAAAERATFVVCGPANDFTDNVETTCAECGAAIVHRPYAPKAPIKICLRCARRHFESDGKAVIATTARMGEELRARGVDVEG